MKRKPSLTMAILGLLVASVSVLGAQQAAPPPGGDLSPDPSFSQCGPPGELGIAGLAAPEVVYTARGIGGATEAACTAVCQYGSDQTCTGTTCSKVDQSCPGTRGYCWSNQEGFKYCNECQGCTADCQYGADVTCGGSSCWAVDQSCPGTRGSCYDSDLSVTKYCNPCPYCEATATCQGSSPVSCNANTNDCFKFDDCYAYCNETYYWCPGASEEECPV